MLHFKLILISLHNENIEYLSSQNFDWFSHCSFDVNGFKIVPSFFKQRRKEVECHNNVLSEFIISHFFVSCSNIHASNFLKLPFNWGFDIIKLLSKRFLMSDWLREHTNSVQYWSKNDWDLLYKCISCEKSSIFLCPLFDKLFVFIEFFKIIKSSYFNIKVVCCDLISVFLISNQADFHLWSWNVWKSNWTNESLIFLWIVIF